MLERFPGIARTASGPGALARMRERTAIERRDLAERPDLIRKESIRRILAAAGGDGIFVDEAYDVFYAERLRVELYDDVVPALEWLAARYAIVAVTNGNSSLAAAGIDRFFDAAVTAQEVGAGKPEARIFHEAARKLKLSPSRILHVGDSHPMDVVGARRAGMAAAWLVREPVPPAARDTRDTREPDAHAVVGSLGDLCLLLQGTRMATKDIPR
ncbi:hypothetical protein GCM10023144_00240 [Pigmentiphaga soli]|uniref:HAD family hydrolase n=2 Tax=Pigmentiphaga soli TaxID=1007095 RepID=A0ABP8GC65_9BURK